MLTECRRPKPDGVLDWKARISIRTLPSREAERDDDGESKIDALNNRMRGLADNLCYACHTMLTSRSPRSQTSTPEGVVMPVWVNSNSFASLQEGVGVKMTPEGGLISRMMDRVSMKDSIDKFLLDE